MSIEGTGSTIEGNLNLTSLLIKGGSTLKIAGGTIINTTNLTITENSQIIAMGKNTEAQVNGEWVGVGVTFNTENLNIDTGSKISADEQGYSNVNGAGPGAPATGTKAGGSYGDHGGTINHVGDPTNAADPYGDAFNPTDLGSTGGYGDDHNRNAGVGGGAIIITAEKLILNGSISANGQSRTSYETGGAGSGGSININTAQLSGLGSITANGGNAWNDWLGGAGGGAGGRILVRYQTSDFTGTITTNGGTGKQYTSLYGDYTINGNGEKGSVIYTPTDHLIINYDLVFPKDSTINLNYNQVTVQNGATITIGGGSTVNILGKLIVTENSQIICQSKNTDSQVNGEWAGVGVTINADDLTIATGSKITANSQGYTPYNGPGGAGSSAGGTHAGIGGNGAWPGYGGPSTNTYGNPYKPTELGSGGGGFDRLGGGSGGSGGGAIKINVANNLKVDGTITANGESKDGRGAGAGAGGSLYILTRNMAGSGTITANGGNSISYRGGGGGGGRIAIYYEETTYTGTTSTTGGTGVESGTDGTVRLVKSTGSSILNSNMVETSSDQKTWTDTLISKTATITGIPASGTINGTLDLTNLELVQIAKDPLKNSGFFKGKWNATLNGVQYRGDVTGMFYLSGGVLLFKGTASGDIIGTIETRLTEKETGSGNYNTFSGIWKLSTFSENPMSDILTLDLTPVTYSEETQHPNTQLTLLQTNIKGTATGQYNGQLNTVLNHLIVSDTISPYYGEGFSTLSYISTEGSGSGWTYDQLTDPLKTELVGLFNGPLSGIITGLLDETTTPRTLNLQISKTDAGLPPMADVEVRILSPRSLSPGQTIDYVIEYWNRGVANAENVKIYEYLYPFVEYISNTGNGIYNSSSQIVEFNVGNLIPGQKGTISVKCKVLWGLGFGWTFITSALIGTDSKEIDAYLNPEKTVLTPEWSLRQRAYARWYPAQQPMTLPQNDPNPGITPNSVINRFQQTINQINALGFGQIANQALWQLNNGKYNLDREDKGTNANGREKIDWDANDLGVNINPNGVASATLSGTDSNWNKWTSTNVAGDPNPRWENPAIKLMGYVAHEIDHNEQCQGIMTNPNGAWGEQRSFCREHILLTAQLNDYLQKKDYDSASKLANYMKNRWLDLESRTTQGATGQGACPNEEVNQWSKQKYKEMADIETQILKINGYITSTPVPTPEELEQIIAETTKLDGMITAYDVDCHNTYFSRVDLWDTMFNGHNQEAVITPARDPNILYGPEGYVLPGDTLNYRVECENVGEGTAYGVYITDTLEEDLDTSTLQIGPVKSTADDSIIAPAGVYDSATRTIKWEVGELGSGKGAYAEYSVKLRSDATDGTSVINYATVFFPSVPEETKTNAIVSIVDLTPPTVTINNPASNANIRGTIVVNVTATDTNPVSQVLFEIKNSNNIVIATGTDTNGTDDWTFNWDTTNLNGQFTITATATDEAGNSNSNTITVNADNNNPTVTINSPANNANVKGTVPLTATANDNVGVTQVVFTTSNGQTYTDNNPSDGWHYNWDTTNLNGQYTVTVTAYDASGNNGTDTKTYNVDNTAPTVTITNPANNINISGATTVTATANDNVEVTQVVFTTSNGQTYTDNTTADGWHYNWDPTNLATGDYTITATAYDAGGNNGTNQITLHILADIYASVTFSTTNLVVGEDIVSTVKIGNNGPGKGTDIVLTYTLPEGMELMNIRTDPLNQGTVKYNATTRTLKWTIGDVLIGDYYLYVTQRPLWAGNFTSMYGFSSTSTRGLTNTNLASGSVSVTPLRTDDTGSYNSEIANAASTTQKEETDNKVPLQNTGLPLGTAILAMLMIASGLFKSRREK